LAIATTIVIGSLLFFAVVWWLVLSIIANLGGWASLAKQFPATDAATGRKYGWQSGRFNWCDYNGCITIRVTDAGLRISMPPPFRPGHRPMFLPWSALHVIEVCDRWYGRYVTIDVGSPVVARIRLPLKIMDAAGRTNSSQQSDAVLP
jgi:hypothetical protein